jgi:flavorubredoxin
MLPTIAGFLEFLKGMEPKNRIGCTFGSHGWAGGAVKEIEGVLQQSGVEIIQPGLAVKYVPDEAEIKKCYEFGKNFASKIK